MFADFIVPFWNGMPISPGKSACGKVSRVRHMVPGGSRESLPKRKVRFADQPPGTANGLQISSMSALKLFSPSDIALTEAGLFGNYKVARQEFYGALDRTPISSCPYY